MVIPGFIRDPIPLKSIIFCALTPGYALAMSYRVSPLLTTYVVYGVEGSIFDFLGVEDFPDGFADAVSADGLTPEYITKRCPMRIVLLLKLFHRLIWLTVTL